LIFSHNSTPIKMKAKLELNSLTNSLRGFLPLANSHMVHFFTHNSFEKNVPKCLQEEIMSLDVDELNKVFLGSLSKDGLPLGLDQKIPNLINFLRQTQNLSLRQNSLCLSFDELFEKLESKCHSESTRHIFKHLMSVKKSHEVEIMSAVIATIAKEENCTHIVDVGGGKGYLSSVLALQHQLKVLSVDSSLITSKGAEKQMPKIEKLWKILQKKSSDSSNVSYEKSGDNDQYSELCKIAVNFITDKTNITEMIKNSFLNDEVSNVMLAGLHTCGNLAASSIRLFVKDPDNIRCLVNVGCCYNLIAEEFETRPSWLEEPPGSGDIGFPMSACLREQQFVLGRNARMLATQPPDRMCHGGMVETDSLFYRALLELYLQKKLGTTNEMSPFRVGKFKRKCSSFTEYVHKSIKRLGIHIEVDDAELERLCSRHAGIPRKQLHGFFLLKLTIAPAVEATIMLDRLLYLHEKGIQDAYLTQLFDPVVSPRCFAIVAFNKPRTR